MYIVTGGAGFIGSNVVRALNRQGIADIMVVEDFTRGGDFRNLADCQLMDYMDSREFRRAVAAGRLDGAITGICHQGACADTTEHDSQYMLDTNFTFSKELLHFALAQGIPMVYASSAAVYGANTTFLEEPDYERPLNVYGYSKLLFDQHVRRVVTGARSTVVGLRYFNVYGPRERHKQRMASMVYQLYRQLREHGVARLFNGTDGYGDGGQRRDFVFVGDVVSVNLHFLLHTKDVHAVVNVGSGASRSFNDVAQALIQGIGTGAIEYFPMPEALHGKYQNFTQGDLKRLRLAGYTANMTALEDGLAEVIPCWEHEHDPTATAGSVTPNTAPKSPSAACAR
jgi:ADP-L-glycero-D-manno-heptose 6-epimerase